jgi:hypothetical protein
MEEIRKGMVYLHNNSVVCVESVVSDLNKRGEPYVIFRDLHDLTNREYKITLWDFGSPKHLNKLGEWID